MSNDRMFQSDLRSIVELGDIPSEGVPCVYLLKDTGGSVVYVGQSMNLQSRISTHINNRIKFTCFDFEVVEESDMNDREATLIVENDSELNQTLPGNSKYVNRSTAKSAIALRAIRLANRLPSAIHREPKYEGARTYSYVNKKDQDKILSKLDDLFCDFENEYFDLCDAHYRVTIENKAVLVDGRVVSITKHQALAARLRKEIVKHLLQNHDSPVSIDEIKALFCADSES